MIDEGIHLYGKMKLRESNICLEVGLHAWNSFVLLSIHRPGMGDENSIRILEEEIIFWMRNFD